jgi:tetratricopeptide (TPR) repeat protein
MIIKKDTLIAARVHYANQVHNFPDKPELWMQLGSVNIRMGHYQEALDCFRRVLDLDRKSVAGHMCLAQTQLMLNRYEEAESSLSKALSIDPNNAQAALGQARIMEMQGRLEDAARLYNVTIRLDSANIDALLGLGRVTVASGQHVDAEAIYKRVLEIQPGNANAYMLLGSLSLKTGALYRAEGYFRNAIESEPEQAMYYYHLGRTQVLLGRVDDALSSYRRASELSPELSDATGGIAEIYTLKGEYDKAYECIHPIVEKGIPSVQVAVVLADICGVLDICDRAIDYVGLVISNQNITYDSRVALRHVLGKLYDFAGEYDKAFIEYRRANRMQPAGSAPEIQDRYIDKLIQIWSSKYLSVAPKASKAASLPVFIVGMPRSGSTLVEQILAAHPDVSGGGELPYMQELICKLMNWQMNTWRN